MIDKNIGKRVLMIDGHTRRILHQDKKGLYIIKDGIKNYVKFHKDKEMYSMTGEWDHKESE